MRKIQDEPPHVPTLDQVRSEVIVAWKMSQARPLAAKAAAELASQIKAKGATLKDPKIDNFRVISIPPITRSQTSFVMRPGLEPSPVVETPIPAVPNAGEAFRDAYFGLKTGSVDVVPNEPVTVYYVMALDRREPATFNALYAPNSDAYRYTTMALEMANKQQEEQWMGWLRQQAGLKPDWIPPDEVKKEEAARS